MVDSVFITCILYLPVDSEICRLIIVNDTHYLKNYISVLRILLKIHTRHYLKRINATKQALLVCDFFITRYYISNYIIFADDNSFSTFFSLNNNHYVMMYNSIFNTRTLINSVV